MNKPKEIIQEEEKDIESIDESGTMTEPFDPNLIKIETQSRADPATH